MKPPSKGHGAHDQCLAKGSFYPHTHLLEMQISILPLSSSSGHKFSSSRSTTCFLQHQLRKREKDQ